METLLLDVRSVPLESARALVELYAEKGSPKYGRAALKYLVRYVAEQACRSRTPRSSPGCSRRGSC